MGVSQWGRTALLVIACSFAFEGWAQAQPPSSGLDGGPPVDAETAKKDEAREHFQKGLLLFDEEAWDGALAEFMRSRQLYPNRPATKNAALCLRKLRRYDEALDMFAELLKLPKVTEEEKNLANREIKTLNGLVGTIELRGAPGDAQVVVDGRSRGAVSSTAPIRVPVGTHVVRVTKQGYEAFETRAEVAGGQSVVIAVRVVPLAKSGRLRVTEQTGKTVEVLVDNAIVGKTPWEGVLPPGNHTIILRGEGNLGTQPVNAPVVVDQVTPLTLVCEELTSTLRIVPQPGGGTISVDRVNVGHGMWEGRVRAGKHTVEIGAEGFLPMTRDVTIGAGKREVLEIVLSRDPSSPLWKESRPRFLVEVDGAFALAPALGGDISGCSAPCSAGVATGFMVRGRGAYQFRSGLMLGVDAGFLLLSTSVSGRATTAEPPGVPPNPGKADDSLRMSGLVAGAAVGLHRGQSFPFTLRLGAGTFLGSMKDHRTGSFSTVPRSVGGTLRPAAPYEVDVTESVSATYFYLAPEARIGLRIGERFELHAGVEALVMFALNQPTWNRQDGPVAAATDGQATFKNEPLAGGLVVVVAPGLGARLEF